MAGRVPAAAPGQEAPGDPRTRGNLPLPGVFLHRPSGGLLGKRRPPSAWGSLPRLLWLREGRGGSGRSRMGCLRRQPGRPPKGIWLPAVTRAAAALAAAPPTSRSSEGDSREDAAKWNPGPAALGRGSSDAARKPRAGRWAPTSATLTSRWRHINLQAASPQQPPGSALTSLQAAPPQQPPGSALPSLQAAPPQQPPGSAHTSLQRAPFALHLPPPPRGVTALSAGPR